MLISLLSKHILHLLTLLCSTCFRMSSKRVDDTCTDSMLHLFTKTFFPCLKKNT